LAFHPAVAGGGNATSIPSGMLLRQRMRATPPSAARAATVGALFGQLI